MAKKNITTDELAGMVQKGFGDVDKKLDAMKYEINPRFDQIEKIILDDHRERIGGLKNR